MNMSRATPAPLPDSLPESHAIGIGPESSPARNKHNAQALPRTAVVS
jgi:hypothetical protein